MKKISLIIVSFMTLISLQTNADIHQNSKFNVIIKNKNNNYLIGSEHDVVPSGQRIQMDNIFCSSLGYTCYGLKDNKVWAVGKNNNGQLGDGTTSDSYKWIPSYTSNGAVLSDIKKISVGNNFALALKNNGEVFAIGGNNFGQLGIGNKIDQHKWIQTRSGISDIASGNGFSYAVDASQGYLFVTGSNYKGQLGTSDNVYIDNWTFAKTKINNRFQILTNVKSASAGNYHGIIELKALQGGRRFMTSGDNTYGQLANNGYKGVSKDRNYWDVAINAPQNIKNGEMYSTAYHNYVLDTSGTIWETGFVRSGSNELANFKKATLYNVKKMTVNYDGVLALKDDGSFFARGVNNMGQLGFGHYNNESNWRETAKNLKGFDIKTLIGASNATYIITSDGINYSTGSNLNGLQAFDNKEIDKISSFKKEII